MLAPIIRRPLAHDSRHKERGVTIALVALAIVGIISMAALSIDIGTLYQSRTEAQRAADAAALTAARVISLSGITADPGNVSSSWQPTCGGSTSMATLSAIAIGEASANFVAGGPAPTVTVNYGAGAATADCSTLAGTSFAVNPTVTVQVKSATLPIFFAKVFSLFPGVNYSGTTVSATAAAEAFNPSGSSGFPSKLTTVEPRCVKPWIVPNYDPGAGTCIGAACPSFITPATGAITTFGVRLGGAGVGIVGESFNLVADCTVGAATCNPPLSTSPAANAITTPPSAPNLQYVPGLVPANSPAAPSRAAAGFQQAIAGCDQTTVYQCGIPNASLGADANHADFTENPSGAAGDTSVGAQYLIQYGSTSTTGQDVLQTGSIPYQIQAGSSNATGITGLVSSSNSIATIPVYDTANNPLVITGSQAPVTIVGFLQVFINSIDGVGNVNVTVLNVAGCGTGATGGTARQ